MLNKLREYIKNHETYEGEGNQALDIVDTLEETIHNLTESVNQYKQEAKDQFKGNQELTERLLQTEYRLLESFILYMPKTYRKRNRNWVIVQQFLQHRTSKQGSTSSREKCHLLKIDPDGYTLDRKEESC